MSSAGGAPSPAHDLRCTTQTRLLGEHPAGTAGGADRYVLVPVPLPWPADIGEHDRFRALEPTTGAPPSVGRTKLLAVVPDHRRSPVGDTDDVEERDPAEVELVVHARIPGEASYRRFGTAVEEGTLPDVVAAVRAGNLDDLDELDPVAEVLVCSHGTRDRCCGSMGTLLSLELAAGTSTAADAESDALLVRRCSHLGGHRFAPTVLAFPAGIAMAHVDAGHVRSALAAAEPPASLERHLRGWVGLSDPRAQRADVAALSALGWGWWDRPRSAQVRDDGREPVVVLDDGDGTEVTVVLRVAEAWPVPVCGEPIEAAVKRADGWDVVAVEVASSRSS